MNLKEIIKKDMLIARKAGNKVQSNLLSSVLGETDRIGKELTNEQIEQVIRKMHNNLVNEIGTTESIAESKLLEKYLPKLMSKEEIEKELSAIIANINAESIKDMGRVMGEFTRLFKGKADMKIVSGMVKEKLN